MTYRTLDSSLALQAQDFVQSNTLPLYQDKTTLVLAGTLTTSGG